MNRPFAGDGEATVLLQAWSGGDPAAGERLMSLLYHELRRRAAAYLRGERPGHTLQPTAPHGSDVLAIDQLLTRLATFDARKSRVIELRYFGGLSLDETAQVPDLAGDGGSRVADGAGVAVSTAH